VPSILELIELTQHRPTSDKGEGNRATLSADHLSQFRRALLQILASIDAGPGQQGESVASRIRRLAREGKTPREVAALMRTITEDAKHD